MRRPLPLAVASVTLLLVVHASSASGGTLTAPRPRIQRAGPIMTCAGTPTLINPQPLGFGSGFYSFCGDALLSAYPDQAPSFRSIIGRSSCVNETGYISGGRTPGLYTAIQAAEVRSRGISGFLAVRWVGADGAIVVQSVGLQPTAVYHVGGGRGWVVDHRVQVVPCSRRKAAG